VAYSAASNSKTLLCPDKDADGLSAGVIMHRTLTALGLPASQIAVHLVSKGANIHDASERELMASHSPAYVIVLDQGSRASPPVVSSQTAKSLIIDHHLSDVFPENALVLSACHYPPVATTALLTYTLCTPLDPNLAETIDWLACIGTHGDLGNTLKWQPPFPDMRATFKTHTKKSINDAVSLLNAPRRTATYDVITAWTALLDSDSPKELLNNSRLQAARADINLQVEMHTHTPPRFTPDGRIAVLKINSAAQIHPVIATRWAGYLNSKALEIVVCANYGYSEGKVNFSCRIARCAKSRDPSVNIIASLKEAAALSQEVLTERLGESFARGHKEASGGIVPLEEFEELMGLLRIGEKKAAGDDAGGEPRRKKIKTVEKSPQKNTLGNYFVKK
jgi:hypothetical protein